MRKPLLTGVVAVTAAVATMLPTTIAAASLRDPGHNAKPSAKFLAACSNSDAPSCDAAALADFRSARAHDGVGPMTLPRGFDKLTPRWQLFVLVNVERVDRGLKPFTALSSGLDRLAQTAAHESSDDAFGQIMAGTRQGSNWSTEGESTLFDAFCWTYSDGPGQPGCFGTGGEIWIHRNNILGKPFVTSDGTHIGQYRAPRLMGTASVGGVPHPSTTEVFVGHAKRKYVRTEVRPHWSHFTKKFPLGVATHQLTVTAGGHGTLRVWASGTTMQVTATITTGGSQWSVSSRKFTLRAGHQRTLHITHGTAATLGTLRLTTAHDTERVVLVSG